MAKSVFAEGVNFMSLLSDVNRRRLLENSTRALYPAGTIALHPDGPPGAFLLDSGLVRGYATVSDGRQTTVAFGQSHELIGGTTILGNPAWYYVQMVIESTMTTLDLEVVRKLAATEPEVIGAIAAHLAERVRGAFRLIAVRSLGDIKERLAYDLLERACRTQLVVGRLEARATHADLADSIGSSREVVSRALSSLRAARIVETAPGVVRIVSPTRLEGIVRAFVI